MNFGEPAPPLYNVPHNGEGWNISCADGRVGQALHYVFMDSCICIRPPLHPSKNLRLLNFANLTLHTREARGVPRNQWFSLAAAKENDSESNLVSTLVTLYNHARTYFTNP